jgi:Fibronectin type III domain
LKVNQSVFARVRATNAVGSGAYSTVGNGAIITMSYVPDSPQLLVRSNLTTTSSITFTWSDGLSNGGLEIIDYLIRCDQANGTWITIATGVTTQQFTMLNATITLSYQFTVTSRNAIGFS